MMRGVLMRMRIMIFRGREGCVGGGFGVEEGVGGEGRSGRALYIPCIACAFLALGLFRGSGCLRAERQSQAEGLRQDGEAYGTRTTVVANHHTNIYTCP